MGKLAYVAVTFATYFFCWPILFWSGVVGYAVIEENLSTSLGGGFLVVFVVCSVYGVHHLAAGVYNFVTRWEKRVAPEV